MGAEIKGLCLQHVGDAADGVWVEQDAAQHGLFGLQVLGRHRIGQGLKTGFRAPV